MIKHFEMGPGQRWGALTSVCNTGKTTPKGAEIWEFDCDCGVRVKRSAKSVITAKQRDCGCGAANHKRLCNLRQKAREWPVMIESDGQTMNHRQWADYYGVSEGTILGLYYAHRPLQEALLRPKTKETLCWDCANACGLCSWSHDFIPVPGWTARPTVLYHNKGRTTNSYHVSACPEFVKGRG